MSAPPVSEPVNVDDFEALARARLDPAAYDYFAGAAGDEQTLAENRRAFDRIRFRPRVDVSRIDTATDVLGQRIAIPILLAPTAFNQLAHPDG